MPTSVNECKPGPGTAKLTDSESKTFSPEFKLPPYSILQANKKNKGRNISTEHNLCARISAFQERALSVDNGPSASPPWS